MGADVCPFCEIVAGRAPATIVRSWFNALAIVPLNPVVDGHVLVIPKEHVTDFAENPRITGITMFHAAELAWDMDQPMNLITSKGREATQSVFHLHAHLVPRAENDGLALPWYSGRGKTRSH
jgi:histidine triad (HIT) family protein